MAGVLAQRSFAKQFLRVVAVAILFAVIWYSVFTPVYGAQLGNRELQLDNNYTSATALYKLSFVLSTAGTLGSISVEFCSNDTLPQDPCDVPVGFSDSSAVIANQTGETGFSISSSSTANHLILTRTPSAVTPGPVEYDLSTIVNPSSPGAYFVRLLTYASSDATGSSSDYGGLATAILNSLSINAEVPPYLIFCTGITIPELNCTSATGSYIDFGNLSSARTSYGTSQMLAATNAKSGYSVTIAGTTLQSGNDVITPLTNSDVSRPGTSQFGLNLRANSSPNGGSNPSGPGSGTPSSNYDVPDFYRFDDGDVVASNPSTDNIREYTTSYIVNVAPSQAPGVYVSTMTYICLANF
jgi:hypothetical protein